MHDLFSFWRRERGIVLATVPLALVLALACDRPTATPSRELFEEAATWQRIGTAWVRGVPPSRLAQLDLPADGELEGLVVADEPGGLRVTVGGVDPELGGRAQSEIRPLRARVRAGDRVEIEAPARAAVVRPRLGGGRARPRRILLIVADTLRADHVTNERMPEVLRHFEGGLRAELAFAAGSWTLPSMASLFTGETTTALRAADDGLIALADGAPTLAGRLAEQGFVSVAVVANPTVNHENGYSQGFDVFHVPRVADPGATPDASWVLERARAAVEALADDDLFLYLHFMEAHDPYRNHETGEALVAPSLGEGVGEAELAALEAAYASEARYLSRQLGAFLDEAEANGVWDLVVFTADHGEELLDHGGMKHGPTILPEVTQVPLLLQGRRRAEIAERIEPGRLARPVSLADLGELIAGVGPWPPSDRVVVEAFVHAPPRWGWVEPGAEWVVSARDLPPGELDTIGTWVRGAFPNRLREPLGGGAHDPSHAGEEVELPPEVVEALLDQYRGYEAGVWIAGGEDPLETTLRGASLPIRCWVGCERVELVTRDAAPVLSVRAGRGFVVVFARAEVPGEIGFGGELTRVEAGEVSVGGSEWLAWIDEGGSRREVGGVEQTLERLEALGYIER